MAERVDFLPDAGGAAASDLYYWTVTLYLKGIFDFDEHLKEVTIQAKRTEAITSGETATVTTSTLIYEKFRRASQEAQKTSINFDAKLLENDVIYLDFSYEDGYESSAPNYSETLGKPPTIGKQNRIMLTANKVLKERSRPKARYFVKHNDDYIGFDYSSVELGAEKVMPAYNLQTGLYAANMFSILTSEEQKDLLYNNYEAYGSVFTNFQKDNCIKLPYYYNFRGEQKQVCLVKEGYLPKPFDFYFDKETIQYTPFKADNKLVCLKEAGWLNNNNYTDDMHLKKTWPKDRILQIDRKSAYKRVNNTWVATHCIDVWDITDPNNDTHEFFSDADNIYYITVSGYVEFFGTNHNVFSELGYVPKCLMAIMCGGGGGGSTRLTYARATQHELSRGDVLIYSSGAAGAGAAWCGFILDFGDNKNTFEIHLGCYGEASQVCYTDIYGTTEPVYIKQRIKDGNGWDGQKSYVYNIALDKNKCQLATFGGQGGHIEYVTDKEDSVWKEYGRDFYKTVNGQYNENSHLGTIEVTTDGGKTWDEAITGLPKSDLESCGIYYITGEIGGNGGISCYEVYDLYDGYDKLNLEAWMGSCRGNVSANLLAPANIPIYKAASCCYILNDSGKGGMNYIHSDNSSAPGGGGSLGHGGNADTPKELCGYLGGGGAGTHTNVNGSNIKSGTGGRGALWLFY